MPEDYEESISLTLRIRSSGKPLGMQEENWIRSLDRFHTIYSIGRKNAQTDFCGPGGRLTRKQLTSRPDHLWPEIWKTMVKNAKLKENQKWSNEKLFLENARKLRLINLFHWPGG